MSPSLWTEQLESRVSADMRKTMGEVLQNRELRGFSFTHSKYEMILDTQGEKSSRQLDTQIWSSGGQSELEIYAWGYLYRNGI